MSSTSEPTVKDIKEPKSAKGRAKPKAVVAEKLGSPPPAKLDLEVAPAPSPADTKPAAKARSPVSAPAPEIQISPPAEATLPSDPPKKAAKKKGTTGRTIEEQSPALAQALSALDINKENDAADANKPVDKPKPARADKKKVAKPKPVEEEEPRRSRRLAGHKAEDVSV
eukprot:TRINITY_DN6226_c0_g1_i1.p1 TRINITY_DN6226_c0_g1~~TRINITY_DN6226_c0_g1_i1.p1  ORF type:complete len:169 (-),score=44.75 TRINITY_DN6226_c0_g1_i1:88-594(-)